MHLRARLSRLATLPLAVALAAGVAAHTPHDEINAIAISPDFANDGTFLAELTLSQTPMLGRSTDRGLTWELYGAPLALDQVNRLQFSTDYANDKTIFAATENSGVWRSTDGGTNWTSFNIGLTDLRAKDIAVSPGFAASGLVLVATPSGTFRSTDRGVNWSLTSAGMTAPISANAVAFGPAANLVYTGGKLLHMSSDGGVSWSPAHNFVPDTIKSIAVSPNFVTDTTLAVSFGFGTRGVEFSVDQGTTFTPMNAGLTDLAINRVVIASDGTYFACSKSTTGGLFRADSTGGAWTQYINEFFPFGVLTSDHFRDVAVAPDFATDPTVIMGAYEGFYHSSDRGSTWNQSTIYSLRVQRHIELSPNYALDKTMFTGSYGGSIMKYVGDTSGTWESLAIALPPIWSSHLSLSPNYTSDQTVFYAYSELWRSQDRGVTWARILTPVGGGLSTVRAFDTSPAYGVLDTTMIVGYGDGNGTFLSTDDGATWVAVNGVPATDATSDIEFSPNFPLDQTVFLATTTGGLWRSTDGGVNFVQLTAGLPNPLVLKAVAISPNYALDSTVFAGTTYNGLYRSTNGGATWLPANNGMPTNDTLSIEEIALTDSFATDATLYVATLADGLFRSTNGATSFARRDAGLPLTTPWSLDVSSTYATDKTVVISTTEGLYRTTDSGTTWHPLPGMNRADDRYPLINYSGTSWNAFQEISSTGNQVTISNVAGDAFEYTFLGNEVTWLVKRDGFSGIAEVFLDGVSQGQIDLYLPGAIAQQVAFNKKFIQTDWHTIRVEVTGLKSAAATNTMVKSDGFEIGYHNVDLSTTLIGNPLTVSVSGGGSQVLSLDAFGTFPNSLYLLAGTLGSTTPGFSLLGWTIPLKLDAYFLLLVNNPNTNGFIPNNYGTLDAMSKATMTFTLPPGLLPASVVGATIQHAAVVLAPFSLQIQHVTNPTPVSFSF